MPFGVRRLTTPMGRTPIEDLSQLEHLGKYVATSSKYSRGINLSALERLKKARDQAEAALRRERSGGSSFWIPTSPSYQQKLRMSRTLGLTVLPSKQVFFVLNGKGSFYRTLLNPLRLPSMEQLLAEVSDGLQVAIFRLYRSDGTKLATVAEILGMNPAKVIACPRNERPYMREDIQLPAISQRLYKPKSNTTTSGSSNGIEKPHRYESALRRNTRKATGAPRKKIRSLPSIISAKSPQHDETDSGKANSISSYQTDEQRIEDDHPSSDFPGDEPSTSVRSEEEFVEMSHDEHNHRLRSGSRSRESERDLVKDESPPGTGMIRSGTRDSQEEHNLPTSHGHRPGTSNSQKEDDLPTRHGRRNDTADSQREDDLPTRDGRRNVTADSQREEDLPTRQGRRNGTADSQREEDLPTRQGRRKGTTDSQREEDLPTRQGHRNDSINSQREDDLPTRHGNRNGTADSERELHLPSTAGSRKSTGQKEHDLPSGRSSRRTNSACSQKEDHLPSGRRTGTPDNELEDVLPSGRKSNCSQHEDDLPSARKRQGTGDSQREHDLPSARSDRGKTGDSQLEDDLPTTKDENRPESATVPETEGGVERFVLHPEEAAVKIQAAFRGFNARKKLKVGFSQTPELNPNEMKSIEKLELEQLETEADENAHRPPTPFEHPQSKYTVQVMTGHRWGAETEADLHLILHGDDGTSDKIILGQENTEPRFRQNQVDTFYVDCPLIGTINKITIGHDRQGYGAGVFIEHVIVTENQIDGRQFIFFVRKWLDSGQVDGKLSRTASVAAFYYLNSIPDETIETQGRWEFVFHSGTQDGQGGTTSNLSIYGYGTDGSSVTTIENDATMQQAPSTSLVQVDFGAIGELIKVRFEIDGHGEQPNYYIEYVEMKDLDTEERLAVRVGKWLDVTGEHKRPQPFREVPVYRSGVPPLALINYEGRLLGSDMSLMTDSILHGELHGELDTGVFPIFYNETKKEFNFKVEAVFLGRINKLKIIGNFSDDGQAVLESMSVLQDIWDCYAPGISVADHIIAPTAYVRESLHCPYRYVLGQSRVGELDENRPYFKMLCVTGMEGLSTRNKKEEMPKNASDWELDMAIEGYALPEIWLCGGRNSNKMKLEGEREGIVSYSLSNKAPAIIDKVRIDGSHIDANFTISKVRLTNTTTHSQVRFPNLTMDFQAGDIYEFSTVYPDIPPKPNLFYRITIRTISGKGHFLPYLTLIGSESDSGARPLGRSRQARAVGIEKFELEAVNLGDLREVEISVENDKNFQWTFEVIVSQSEAGLEYQSKEGSITKSKPSTRLPLEVI